MLRGMREAGRSWLGKLVVALLFGLLIFSFAIWGIGDIFRPNPDNVATIGKRTISLEEYRNAYQNEIQRLIRQTRQNITPERARQMGIDSQILSRLVTEATLDEAAKGLGLAVSDDMVAQSIFRDKEFQNASGQFDKAYFADLLRANGLSERNFVEDRRKTMLRLHISQALASNLAVPETMQQLAYRYAAERRSVSYIALTRAQADDILLPSEEELSKWYQNNKNSFVLPEYRSFEAVVLNPQNVEKQVIVSGQELQERYAALKDTRFTTPEKRSFQQIAFPNADEAKTALSRVRDSKITFTKLAEERNIKAADLELGLMARADLFDPAIAEAAFAIEKNAVSNVVQSRFGPVLLYVTAIEQKIVQTFENVSQNLTQELVKEKTRNLVQDIHDKVDEARAGAQKLADIAKDFKLDIVTLESDRSGKNIDLLEKETVLKAVFASDLGVDNEVVRFKEGGYLWFDVQNIVPPRARTYEEAAADVRTRFEAEQIANQLKIRADILSERINKGESLETIASELRLNVLKAANLGRGAAQGGLSSSAVERMFSLPVGQSASISEGDGTTSILFRVDTAQVPPLPKDNQQASYLQDRMREALGENILTAYLSDVQKTVGIQINAAALNKINGND